MKRLSVLTALALLASFGPSTASAQGDQQPDRFELGVGFGLVDLSNSVVGETTETYATVQFRILMGGKNTLRDESSLAAYLEPEIAYWEREVRLPLVGGGTTVDSQSDLLVGINMIGTLPFTKAVFFFGAGLGMHFFDLGLSADNMDLGTEESFGVNIQTGINVRVGGSVSVWGLVRTDLVEAVHEVQSKIVLGLRFSFG